MDNKLVVSVPLKIPVLFVIFNRPDLTQQVFDVIKKVRPKSLFISADGPRPGNSNDITKCEQTRRIREQVDWECEVHIKFSDINLGCKKSVSSGIDWYFEHVDQGIILEDDCLPDLSFFAFCETMLERYRNHPKIMGITGTNMQFGKNFGDGSYYFSRHMVVWGWATWKRAWQKFEYDMEGFTEFKKNGLIKKIFPNRKTQQFWLYKFDEAYNGTQSWAFPWAFSLMNNDGLCVTPNINLVSNIGFNRGGVHANDKSSLMDKIPLQTMEMIVDPTVVAPAFEADMALTCLAAKEQMPALVNRIVLMVKKSIHIIIGDKLYEVIKSKKKHYFENRSLM